MRLHGGYRLYFLTFIVILWIVQEKAVYGKVIRKNVDHLTPDEILELQVALRSMQDDDGPTGYQAISAYHGEPADCKAADGSAIVCCLHGMPTFPMWHRLYIVQFEQAMAKHGSKLGVPYWDWTKPMTHLPELVQHPLFIDPNGKKAKKNVFYSGEIKFEEKVTSRAVDARLYEASKEGNKNFLLQGVLNALEHEDFCHFEVQFEVAHNPIHYLVGGRITHSMSSLEYTSYDPLFFLHHSNVERQFALWQALQKHRGLPTTANCGLNLFHKPMEPFGRETNPFKLTKDNAKPSSLFDYHHLEYEYDDLTLNGMNIEQLDHLLKERQESPRVYANFRLGGIKTSAKVKIMLCIPTEDRRHTDNCDNGAGQFFILGGANEMPWNFAYPYLHEITDTVRAIGLEFNGDYYVNVEVTAINGTLLADDIIPKPLVTYVPRRGFQDSAMRDVDETKLTTRKNINSLSKEEVYELRVAMERFMADKSINGYQALAEFHGLPAKCPRPDALNRVTCCVHGMATFPHWHRLVLVQFEDALAARGSPIGVPYWDWTKSIKSLPHLFADETYENPYTNETKLNPFFKAPVEFLRADVFTARQINPVLFKQRNIGDHGYLFDNMMLAFEQEDFCDFEVQFEVTHNTIHAWIGGNETYSMSSLHYTSFDPLFWLHHSQVDRLWAIWQDLQIQRGKPYKAYCANSEVHRPMKPFSFESPLNDNENTKEHAVPNNVYDYQSEFEYTYDTLFFGGMSIRKLQSRIEANKARERVFAGFLLMGIKTSAIVDLSVVTDSNQIMVGSIAIIGGSKEMSWRYDRLYKHEITAALNTLGVDIYGEYSLRVDIKDMNGTAIPVSAITPPIVILTPQKEESVKFDKTYRSRRDVGSITKYDMNELRIAMAAFAADKTVTGYQQVAAFHGSTQWCPSPDAAVKYACCQHGMATFPHWHRLLTVNFENGLRRNGYYGGIPYWDWTRPIHALPTLVAEEQYIDDKGEVHPNPFFSGAIDEIGATTSRAPSPTLFEVPEFGHYTHLADEIFYALEQEDFCNFEVQFEIAHNHIHALVGGTEPFSMSSLEYSAFDPIFMLHHSNVDRLWATWQALQKFRGKTYNSANCAIEMLRRPMSPFSLSSDINPDPQTREHSVPFDVFDYKKAFNYEYDTLEINGLSIPQLSREINRRKAKNRVFVTFMLEGLRQSLFVEYYIKDNISDTKLKAGEFYVLGSENEMPWKFDRSYKADITKQMDDLNLNYADSYSVEYTVTDMSGNNVEDIGFESTVIFDPGRVSYGGGNSWTKAATSANRIRKNLNALNKGEINSLRSALKHMKKDGRFEEIAAFHGLPAQCPNRYGTSVYTCCMHGMPTFPHWHRLYVALLEDELLARGSGVAVPYWDWVKPFDALPKLISEASYYNSRTLNIEENPFFNGKISFENSETDRDPRPELFNNKYLYDHTMFAFEQTNFCEFEVHFEVLHNTIHSWLGGRDPHSMSSLDYAAYDPVFFLHHSNVDRLWAIWQELQRYRKLPFNEANCALPLMNQPMRPFSNSTANQDRLTYANSRPNDVFDYQNALHYKYDTLSFNGLNIIQLSIALEKRKHRGRVFVGILLHGVKASADVRLYICIPISNTEENCSNYAGIFSILGGESEMPWKFDRLFRYEITDELQVLGLNQESRYHVTTEVITVNGSRVSVPIFPNPTIIYVPAQREIKKVQTREYLHGNLVRKNVERLSLQETNSLVHAMRRMHLDKSSDGFEAIASFHALPPLCPNPTAKKRHACCLHGMATFLQWHRLFVVQFEQALHRHGAKVGVPYWDWTHPIYEVPNFFSSEKYIDPFTGIITVNPFHHGNISFISPDTITKRNISEYLFERPILGKQTWLFDNIILALEQDDYCNFEVQFEIVHNAIHTWVGGSELYSMNQLHYAAYDPVFYLHHANVDRLWVIWQELQKFRGLPAYETNCALELMNEPLKPFSFGPPYNLNPLTHKYSKPTDVFNYKENFHYEYDMLEINGMSIPQLESYIRNMKQHDRVFAGFLLEGVGTSAYATFAICNYYEQCSMGGHFSVLGGSAEMPWAFNRLYLVEITDGLRRMNLNYDSQFIVGLWALTPNGTVLPEGTISEPTIIRIPAAHENLGVAIPLNRIRRNLHSLEERDVQNLMSAMTRLKKDESNYGFQTIAGYHGKLMCPDPENPQYACCLHGMPTFPHWHRIYLLHFEDAIRRHGANVAIPYWDWTLPITELPPLLGNADYYDALRVAVIENPFLRGYIQHEDTYTVRDIQPELYHSNESSKMFRLYKQVMLMFEQDDYCDFEVQLEVIHNCIHYLIGGHQKYAMSSLTYSSFDPLFYIHHSMVDRLWAIWQELQYLRKMPYDKAHCALDQMSIAMKPFVWGSNPNILTRVASYPSSLFDYRGLGYTYDNLDFHGMSPSQLEDAIKDQKTQARIFAGFLLHGIGISADVYLKVCNDNNCTEAGVLFVLGSPTEMPWHFDRNYRMDITDVFKEMKIPLEDLFKHDSKIHLEVEIETVEERKLDANAIPRPSLIYSPGKSFVKSESKESVLGIMVRKNANSLTPSERENLRDALALVQADTSKNGYQKIASYHGLPLSCRYPNRTSYACCQHGMVTFPHWHRLFVKQMEDAMKAKGAKIGIPYWDWTTAFNSLPTLVTRTENNPFHHAHIDVANTDTTRAPRPQLFDDPEQGDQSFFYRQIAFALEQTDFCDFEIQFEIGHNAIHSWVGGSSPYGMSTLHYTSYDPLFYLHHSNADRIWAIWQALQKYRGLPYNTANCEINKFKKPMSPFSSEDNHNAVTKAHSTGFTSFDYHQLEYDYDNLNFHGMTIPQLDVHLKKSQEKDRVFAGFLLRTIGQSADVNFDICRKDGECTFGGTFVILGGQHEMFWAFDRLFLYDITKSLLHLRIDSNDDFDIEVTIMGIDGKELPSDIFPEPTFMFKPGTV